MMRRCVPGLSNVTIPECPTLLRMSPEASGHWLTSVPSRSKLGLPVLINGQSYLFAVLTGILNLTVAPELITYVFVAVSLYVLLPLRVQTPCTNCVKDTFGSRGCASKKPHAWLCSSRYTAAKKPPIGRLLHAGLAKSTKVHGADEFWVGAQAASRIWKQAVWLGGVYNLGIIGPRPQAKSGATHVWVRLRALSASLLLLSLMMLSPP